MKTRKELLPLIMIILLFNTALTVQAEANADELYKKAFKAVMQVKKEGTQKAINEAREAIRALKNTEAAWAIGEFSKQVDNVQQPLLSKTASLINRAKFTLRQSDINEARNAIDKDYPLTWIYSYSSAVDNIQQQLFNNASDLVDKAVNSKENIDLEKAQNSIAELKDISNLSDKPGVLSFIESLETKLRINIIEKRPAAPTGVTYTIKALDAAKPDKEVAWIKWSIIENADYYNIYISRNNDGRFIKFKADNWREKGNFGIGVSKEEKRNYYVKVTVVKGGVESDYSEVISFTI